MKTFKSSVQTLSIGLFALIMITLSSCSKEDHKVSKSQPLKDRVLQRIKASKFKLVNSNGATLRTDGKGGIVFQSASGVTSGTNFSSAEGGYSFSTGDVNNGFSTPPEGVNYSNNTGGGSFGGGLSQGGGSFSIKNKNVDLDYVFCAGSDIFGDFEEFPDEVKVLIGVAGDLENAENPKLDYLVIMFVIGNGTSFNIDLENFEEDNFDGRFAVIQIMDFSSVKGSDFDFDDAKLYISIKGSLSASSGSYIYNNMDFYEMEANQTGGTPKKVKGSGNLLCQ